MSNADDYQYYRKLLRKEEIPVDYLTWRQVDIVRLYYVETHSMREIAKILNINVSTVSRTLENARKRLDKWRPKK